MSRVAPFARAGAKLMKPAQRAGPAQEDRDGDGGAVHLDLKGNLFRLDAALLPGTAMVVQAHKGAPPAGPALHVGSP